MKHLKIALLVLSCFPSWTNIFADNLIFYTAIRPEGLAIYKKSNQSWDKKIEVHGNAFNPHISNDGNWLIYTSDAEGIPHLFVQNLRDEDSLPKRLTNNTAFENAGFLSFDGRLYFTSSLNGHAQIYWIDFNPHTVTDLSAFHQLVPCDDAQLRISVSPDAEWIAFSSNCNTEPSVNAPSPPSNYRAAKIYLVKKEGTGLQRLTQVDHNEWEGTPSWSKDSKSVYFYSTYDFCNDAPDNSPLFPRIYNYNIQTGVIKRISPKNNHSLYPFVGSNDRLYFTMNSLSDKTTLSKQYGQWSIVSTDTEGSDLQHESDTSIELWGPVINPENNNIWAFGGVQHYAPTPSHFPKPISESRFLISKSEVNIEDTKVDLYGVKGYFPNYLKQFNQLAWCDELASVKTSNLDGSDEKIVFELKDQLIFGLSADGTGEWLATSAGMPFSRIGPSNIWLFKSDGTGSKNMTENLRGKNVSPSFSRDGTMLVFSHSGDGLNQHLYLLNIKTLEFQQLTQGPVLDTMCKFSSVNNDIVFVRREQKGENGDFGNYEISIIKLDEQYHATKLLKITDNLKGAHTHPAFSPDGKKVIFTSELGGYNDESALVHIFNPQTYGDIWVKDLLSNELLRITDNTWEDGLQSWSDTDLINADTESSGDYKTFEEL